MEILFQGLFVAAITWIIGMIDKRISVAIGVISAVSIIALFFSADPISSAVSFLSNEIMLLPGAALFGAIVGIFTPSKSKN